MTGAQILILKGSEELILPLNKWTKNYFDVKNSLPPLDTPAADFDIGQCTLWFRPCLSNRDIIDVMCSSLIMFSASGLSTSTQ